MDLRLTFSIAPAGANLMLHAPSKLEFQLYVTTRVSVRYRQGVAILSLVKKSKLSLDLLTKKNQSVKGFFRDSARGQTAPNLCFCNIIVKQPRNPRAPLVVITRSRRF